MSNLKFNWGTDGEEDARTDVAGVRTISEPWVIDGIELISIKVDYSDGSSEQLPAIQASYELS